MLMGFFARPSPQWQGLSGERNLTDNEVNQRVFTRDTCCHVVTKNVGCRNSWSRGTSSTAREGTDRFTCCTSTCEEYRASAASLNPAKVGCCDWIDRYTSDSRCRCTWLNNETGVRMRGNNELGRGCQCCFADWILENDYTASCTRSSRI